jgi:hypothetical protein
MAGAVIVLALLPVLAWAWWRAMGAGLNDILKPGPCADSGGGSIGPMDQPWGAAEDGPPDNDKANWQGDGEL